METRSKRRRLLRSYVSSQLSDLPAIFDSLNDDTLTTVLEFVGDKSYRSFGVVNKQCKEVYLATKGMTKETFLFGYGPLSRVTDRIERSDMENDQKLQLAVGKGVVFHNRSDVMDWALEELNKYVLNGICTIAAMDGRFDLLEEVFNGVGDWSEIEDVFKGLDFSAACIGKLDVLKWLEYKDFYFDQYECARTAAIRGRIHIIQWLREEKGLELYGYLYIYAICSGHLHAMKWLREQGCPWREDNFAFAAWEGKLNVLQWLHDEGCPWPNGDDYVVHEYEVKPEVVDWLRSNEYGDRIFV